MNIKVNVLCRFLLIHTIYATHVPNGNTFNNVTYNFYEVTAFNKLERLVLNKEYKTSLQVTYLCGVTNKADIPMKVAVEKSFAAHFESQLLGWGIQYYPIDEVPKERNAPGKSIADAFFDWSYINYWINVQISKHDFVQKLVIAKTFEDRDVVMLKASTARNNPAVFIVGGENGMDWMSSAIVLNFFNDILNKKPSIRRLIENFDFYIVPVLNPDGYTYSREKNRFWKKNRRHYYPKKKCENGNVLFGVNLDQNWFIGPAGSEGNNKCNGVYLGPKPLSEAETQGLALALNKVALNMITFINIQGYGNSIILPYANISEHRNNYEIVFSILDTISKNQSNNTSYYVGKTESILYNAFGSVADWVKIHLNTPVVYTVNVEHEGSFLPQPEQISQLSDQFQIMLNHSLCLSKLFYGPLFDKATKLKVLHFVYYTIILQVINNL